MTIHRLLVRGLAAAVPFAFSLAAHAAVSADEAKALGTTLTPTGAEAAGNADGSIPAWSGKWLGAPPHVKYDGSYNPDPYAGEKPLYAITAQNAAQYADKLSDGQKALFAKYPQTYRILVYPTHRDFRYTDSINENTRLNATTARLENDGLTLKGAYSGPAFPIPKTGLEVLYNHMTAPGPWFIDSDQVSAYVQSTGSIAWSEVALRVYNPGYKGNDRAHWDDGINAYSVSAQKGPPRDAGKFTLAWSSNDFVGLPRQAWQYDPGSRRLRKSPDVAFDYPMDSGPRVIDEQNGFNGSPERFEWKLIGKREMIVPFHAYALEDRKLKYKDLIGSAIGHPNPEHIRHELRRVWVIEGTLRKGMRHIYSKRRFYIEEDSWNKVMGENYDLRNQLWRVAVDGTDYAYDAKAYYNNVSIYQDLQAGSYSIEKMSNELPHGNYLNRREPRPGEFTPDGVRRGGQ
ncbi:MAG: DUF1329 domain-containing protein [Solimonas sp.]